MGLCSSTVEDANAEAKNAAGEQGGAKSGTDSVRKQVVAAGTANDDADSEFRDTLRSSLLLVIDRMLTALSYEAEAFADVAKSIGAPNLIGICAGDGIDKLLRELFDVKGVREPEVDARHICFEQQKLSALVAACTDAPWKRPIPNRREVVAKVQATIKKTQAALDRAYGSAPSSDLKLQVNFFSRTLNFCQGDIAADGSTLLYDQIDQLGT